MEAQVRLVHWYDTERRRIACGATGQSNSTKHIRGVTCRACLAVVSGSRAAGRAGDAAAEGGVSYIH